MIFGLGAALGWAVADFSAALISRRIGSIVTAAVGQLAGFAIFTAILVWAHPTMPNSGGGIVWLPLTGVLGAAGYLAFYRGLELGPIALVSPIVAGYASIVIVLSLLILRESVPALALAGAGITLAGVVLASTDPRAIRAEAKTARGGAFYALLAMVSFGFATYIAGSYAKNVGWFETVYLTHLGTSVAMLFVLAVALRTRGKSGGRRTAGATILLATCVVGVIDILAFASLARGSEIGFVSITAAASAVYPALPVLGGLIFLRERPALTQMLGVPVVFGGLLLLAVGR
jgi:drug/metabolite transporter (DMT)-like permease